MPAGQPDQLSNENVHQRRVGAAEAEAGHDGEVVLLTNLGRACEGQLVRSTVVVEKEAEVVGVHAIHQDVKLEPPGSLKHFAGHLSHIAPCVVVHSEVLDSLAFQSAEIAGRTVRPRPGSIAMRRPDARPGPGLKQTYRNA